MITWSFDAISQEKITMNVIEWFSEIIMCYQSTSSTASCLYGTWLMDLLDHSIYMHSSSDLQGLHSHTKHIWMSFCFTRYICIYMSIWNTYYTYMRICISTSVIYFLNIIYYAFFLLKKKNNECYRIECGTVFLCNNV